MKNKLIALFHKPHIVISLAAIVALSIGGIVYANVGKIPAYDFAQVKKGNISEDVSLIGTVKAAENVDLGFLRSGKVVSVGAKVGDTVQAGKVIASLDARDAGFDLENAKLSYQDLVTVDPLDVTKAQNQIKLSQANLTTSYSNAQALLLTSSKDEADVVDGLNDFFGKGYLRPNQNIGEISKDHIATAIKSTFTADQAVKAFIKKYDTISNEKNQENIKTYLDESYNVATQVSQAVKDTKDAIVYLRDRDTFNTVQADAAYASINALVTTSNKTVSDLLAAKASIEENTRAVDEAKQSLADVQDGPDTAEVQAKNLAIQESQKAYSDYFITAPISGVITKMDISVGEITSPNVPVIGLISQGSYQVEAYVSQANLADAVVGADADVVFDAFGPNVIFKAKVVAVDPAETIQNGQSSYKVTFQFVDQDPRIKSGLSATVMLLGLHKENVLIIPRTSLITKNGKHYVLVKSGKNVVQTEVTTGIQNDTFVEIISGIDEGTEIGTFSK